jgi:hypothetical protein
MAEAQAETSPMGPVALEHTQKSLAELENTIDNLPTRDCHRLATSRIQDVLAMEFPRSQWTTPKGCSAD